MDNKTKENLIMMLSGLQKWIIKEDEGLIFNLAGHTVNIYNLDTLQNIDVYTLDQSKEVTGYKFEESVEEYLNYSEGE